jgi:hypothetical protein
MCVCVCVYLYTFDALFIIKYLETETMWIFESLCQNLAHTVPFLHHNFFINFNKRTILIIIVIVSLKSMQRNNGLWFMYRNSLRKFVIECTAVRNACRRRDGVWVRTAEWSIWTWGRRDRRWKKLHNQKLQNIIEGERDGCGLWHAWRGREIRT